MIATLWYWLQSQDDFHDKTSLIKQPTMAAEGVPIKDGRATVVLRLDPVRPWIAVLVPDTPNPGEIEHDAQYFQKTSGQNRSLPAGP